MRKRIKKPKLFSFQKLKEKHLKDPEFKKAYNDLELEFKLISTIIRQRIHKGMTQKKLAEKIGTKQSAIARFESGNANPTLSFVKKLSKALDLTLTVHE